MKTNRNQPKYPIALLLTMLLYEGIKNCRYSFFYAVTKRSTNRQQTKNQLNLAPKRFRSRKAMLWPSKYQVHLPTTLTMFYVTSH